MTAPQLPAGWGPQAPAAPPAQQPYPQQYAPPAQPQYAPPPVQQYPPQYAPPAQPGYPPMGQQYAPPAPPQGYDPYAQFAPQGQPQAPAGPPPKTGTLADYGNQPEAGANFWKFKNPGDTNMGIVSRDLVDTDTVERTYRGQVQKRMDGSSDWVLRIPLTNPDGSSAIWEVGGKDRTALKNAVIAAGEPSGIPKKGWAIRASFTHFQANNGGGQASRIKDVQVAPPNGQALPAQPTTVAPQAAAQAAQQFVQPQQYAAPQQPAEQAPSAAPAAVPQPAQPAPQQYAPQQYQQPQAAPAPQQFAGMPADAAAQFQAMLGGAQPPAQG